LQITIDESAYSTHFRPVLYSWDRYIIAWGGRGASKTDVLYLKYLLCLFEPFYFKLAYINKEFNGIRDGQYAGFKRVAKQVGLYDKLKFYDGDYRIVNQANGNMLIPKGMDDPEKTKGLDNITAIWWDEINKGDLEDFRALNELLRSPSATFLQFAMSFNPVHENHWLRHFFFHPDNEYAIHPDFKGSALLHHSTYKDNEFIDQEQYLKTLTESAGTNSNALMVNVLGKWGLGEPVVNPFLSEFRRDKHVSGDAVYNQNLPLYLSLDFNYEPLCGVFFQFYLPEKRLWYFDEFAVSNANVSKLCTRISDGLIQYQCQPSRLLITGDKNGDAKRIGSFDNLSIYQEVRATLRLAESQFKLTGNPNHVHSRTHCNQIFRLWNVKFNPKMIGTIADCENVSCDAKGNIIKKKRSDMSQRADFLDDVRYSVNTFLPFVK